MCPNFRYPTTKSLLEIQQAFRKLLKDRVSHALITGSKSLSVGAIPLAIILFAAKSFETVSFTLTPFTVKPTAVKAAIQVRMNLLHFDAMIQPFLGGIGF